MRRGRWWSCWKNASATTRRRSQSRSQTPPHRKRKWTRTRTWKRVGSSTSRGLFRRGKALRCDDVNDGPEGTTTTTRRRQESKEGTKTREDHRSRSTREGYEGQSHRFDSTENTRATSRLVSPRLISPRLVSPRLNPRKKRGNTAAKSRTPSPRRGNKNSARFCYPRRPL